MKSKLIVIEGTDCSGKATQTKILKEKLQENGYSVFSFDFPHYESPTGKIIGGPYLGQEEISKCWFEEGAVNVDAKVSSMFYAIDRYYNYHILEEESKKNDIILLDRYTYSAMAHQGGKIREKEKRNAFYEWVEKLEFEMLNLQIPDIKLFLHMPLKAESFLREKRKNKLDENEKDIKHLKNAEEAYKEIAKKYDFITIECVKNNQIESQNDIKRAEEIAKDIWNVISKKLEEK